MKRYTEASCESQHKLVSELDTWYTVQTVLRVLPHQHQILLYHGDQLHNAHTGHDLISLLFCVVRSEGSTKLWAMCSHRALVTDSNCCHLAVSGACFVRQKLLCAVHKLVYCPAIAICLLCCMTHWTVLAQTVAIWSLTFIWMIFNTNSVPSSQIPLHLHHTDRQLMLFREIFTFFCENFMRHT